jgi:hypothetical protein
MNIFRLSMLTDCEKDAIFLLENCLKVMWPLEWVQLVLWLSRDWGDPALCL